MPWPRPNPNRPVFPKPLRKAVLHRDQLCALCQSEPSTEVDHIQPVFLGGLPTPSNAQGVCSACHKIKTARERGLAQRMMKDKRKREKAQDHCGLINDDDE